jgi:hypothetical protein
MNFNNRNIPIIKGHLKSPHLFIRERDVNEVEFFLNKIKNKEYYTYVKLNHGWWDRLSQYEMTKEKFGNNLRKMSKHMAKQVIKDDRCPYLCSEQMIFRVLWTYKYAEKLGKSFYIGASPYGCVDTEVSRMKLGRGKPPRSARLRIYKSQIDHFVSKDITLYSGYVWKNAAIMLRYLELIDSIKDMQVVLVTKQFDKAKSDKDIGSLGDVLGIDDFKHIEVGEYSAGAETVSTSNQILEITKNSAKDKCIILRAGAAAVDIAGRIHGKVEDAFILDLGKSLDCIPFLDKHDKNGPWIRRMNYMRPWYRENL